MILRGLAPSLLIAPHFVMLWNQISHATPWMSGPMFLPRPISSLSSCWPLKEELGQFFQGEFFVGARGESLGEASWTDFGSSMGGNTLGHNSLGEKDNLRKKKMMKEKKERFNSGFVFLNC